MEFPKGTRTENNKVFMKFYNMHKSMMQRCYLKSSGNYPNYGAKGVTVAKEWHNLDDFLSTINLVDGFDFDKIMNGELQLDKDIKYPGNKIYSLEKCMFVSPSQNSGYRPSQVKPFIAVRPDYSYERVVNREEFARNHNMNSRTIWNILQKGSGTYKKWQFFYEDDFDESKIVKRRKFEATSPTGEKFIYEKHSDFAKEHGLSPANISMVLSGKNKTHKGWTFKELS